MFLDIEMPVMNGYRCAQYIRAWEQHVQRADRQRICALSSHDTEDEQQLAQQVRDANVGSVRFLFGGVGPCGARFSSPGPPPPSLPTMDSLGWTRFSPNLRP